MVRYSRFLLPALALEGFVPSHADFLALGHPQAWIALLFAAVGSHSSALLPSPADLSSEQQDRLIAVPGSRQLIPCGFAAAKQEMIACQEPRPCSSPIARATMAQDEIGE